MARYIKNLIYLLFFAPISLYSLPDDTKSKDDPKSNIVPIQKQEGQAAPVSQISLDVQIHTKMVGGKEEIPIGASLPLKGDASLIGNQIFDGMSIFFNKLQKEKSKIPFIYKLEVLNDNWDIKEMRANIKELLAKSPLFLNFWGPDSSTYILKVGKKTPIVSLFPIEGISRSRRSENKNLIYLRATYEQQIEALVHYAVNTLNKRKIAIFYEAGELGEDATAALKRVLKKYNLPLIAEGSYQQGTLNVTHAVDAIVAKAPDAILCFGYPRPSYNFIRQIINKGLYKTVILGLDILTIVQKPLKRSRGVKIITSSVVPDPQRSNLKIVQQYRADMAKYAPNKTLSIFSLEAYINAALLVECTKLVKFPLTIQKLLDSIENVKNVRFKDFVLNFNPTTRTLSNQVWIDTGEGKDWFLSDTNSQEAQDGQPSKSDESKKQ